MLGTELLCRNYWCSHCKEKQGDVLNDPQFIFYIMATKRCNGSCPMCDIQRKFLNLSEAEPDLVKLARVLTDLYSRNLISKISMTGGELLLNPSRTNSLLKVIFDVNPDAKVDITTNGSLLRNLPKIVQIEKLTTIHISRHHFETAMNDKVFGVKTASTYGLNHYADKYPGKISLNCCLIPGFIDSALKVEKYLDWAAEIKTLKSAGFISLMNKNEFCKTSVVDEEGILHWIDGDLNNFDQIHNYDTDICECRVWKRIPKNYFPIIAFWWKVQKLDIPYCRQLIFTADNKVMVNFGEIAEVKF